jgi:hypothetical protein
MQPHEEQSLNKSKSSNRRRNLEFFYFEKIGSRYVLRFTWLTVILVIGLTVVSLVLILIIFLFRSQSIANEPVNVNIPRASPSPSLLDEPIIRQVPLQPPPPRVVKQPGYNVPAPRTPTPDKNINEQVVPRQTPQPQTSKPPT